jgi:hypothetical protein
VYRFCTYFDSHYLTRGLALYFSLRTHCPDLELYVLCMDDDAHASLLALNLRGLIPTPLSDLEAADPSLLGTKANRSRIEYYFTCTASFPLYLMRRERNIELITYLDADLYFYSSPLPLFEELGAGSVGMIAHRFPEALKSREQFGLYNVGWITFRNDDAGIECLTWWRSQCIDWCYDRLEGDRFADQKYLDQWPKRFRRVVVLTHPGANLAPWNVERHHLRIEESGVFVDGKPLIFFHFHGLKQKGRWLYDPSWKDYAVTPSRILRSKVYLPYIRALRYLASTYLPRAVGIGLPQGVRAANEVNDQGQGLRGVWRGLLRWRRNIGEIMKGFLIMSLRDDSPITNRL